MRRFLWTPGVKVIQHMKPQQRMGEYHKIDTPSLRQHAIQEEGYTRENDGDKCKHCREVRWRSANGLGSQISL